jgi:hypothetical protein
VADQPWTEERARQVLQRVVDGEYGEDLAGAVTHLLLELATARGEALAWQRMADARTPEAHPCLWPHCANPADDQALCPEHRAVSNARLQAGLTGHAVDESG